MGAPRLPTPRLKVWMPDGAYFEVQVLNADLVSFDRERARQRWPLPADAPMLWLTYLAWHHLTRTAKLIPACTLKEFEEQCQAVSSDDEPEEGADDDEMSVADPTHPGAEPG